MIRHTLSVPGKDPSGPAPLKLLIIGTGYVGLVSGVCLAELGHFVTCVDNDLAKIASLEAGVMPIFEPGLGEMVMRNLSAGRLQFATRPGPHLAQCDAVLVAVGTPPRKDGDGADLSFLYRACEDLARQAGSALHLIIKSTVPPGTAEAVEKMIVAQRGDLDISVSSNPEFLREGSAIGDFMRPDRIVCGVASLEAGQLLTDIYRPLLEDGAALLFTRRRAAELVKHASNAFLAIKISFINEVADLCEAVDADITEVARAVGMDTRIGPQFLNAGPGYGGSCFPKDTAALLAVAAEHGVMMRALEGAATTNAYRRRSLARRVIDAMGGSARGKTVAVLGLAFKANTDDARESPALSLIHALQRHGAKVRAYDPQARLSLDRVLMANDPYHCAEGADAVVLVTEWEVFRDLDIGLLAGLVRDRIFIDLRNHVPQQQLQRHGFKVYGVGRAKNGLPPLGSSGDQALLSLTCKPRNGHAREQMGGHAA